jgi:Putative lumazine-binding
MMRWTAAIVLMGAALAHAETPADAAARVPLELYLKGHATGNGDYWRQAFHENARIEGIRDGKLFSRTREEFAAAAPGKPADDEAQRKRRIVSVDVTDDAAFAKIELDYPKVRFTDYFTLLKVDGEWKIMSKVYHGQPKP